MSVVVVPVQGTPSDMGRIHGETVASEIEEAMTFYEEVMKEHGDEGDVASRLPRYIDAARAAWPDLAKEVDGLAEGAGIDVEAAWLLNCLEEIWPFDACTTVSAGNYLVHSEQWYAGHKGVAAIVAEPEDGPAFVSATSVGFLPAVGLNAAGFAQGIDSLTASDDGVGIPRVLVSRRALGAASMEDAIAAATAPGRAGGYAHSFKSAEATVVVETTGDSADVLAGTSVHTNHYVSEKLQNVGESPSSGSLRRLTGAQDLLRQKPPRTLEDCVEMMSDHSGEASVFCLHGSGVESATSFGVVCDVAAGTVLASDGPPCEGRWLELSVPGYATQGAARVG